MIQFQAWPKIPRLNRGMVITEKIDGTNAAIQILPLGDTNLSEGDQLTAIVDDYAIVAQSRNKIITPRSDNAGFANWVYGNADSLLADLGEGTHFGEWWGAGIQRRYGKAEKTFSLFNSSRWSTPELFGTANLAVVPVLYAGAFNHEVINSVVDDLAVNGSAAAPGFMDPEGVVAYLTAARQMFKVTVKHDEAPKGQVAA